MTKKSTANDWLKYAGLVIGMVAVLAGILYPEIRRALYLDKTVPPPAAVAAPVAPQVTKTEKPSAEKTRQPVLQVKAGDHNSPAGGTINQGPGSITQIGGQGNQATIIGTVAPPPRLMSSDQVTVFANAVRPYPSSILILYIQNDNEAYQFAKQIGDVLSNAGWTLKQPVTEAMFFREGGGPLYGANLVWRGPATGPGQPVDLNPNTSWGILGRMLNRNFQEDFTVQPSPNADGSSIELNVYRNPKAKSN
jgi:hypothetical protein